MSLRALVCIISVELLPGNMLVANHRRNFQDADVHPRHWV